VLESWPRILENRRMTDKRPRIETLEGLRGIAAIVVFLWHCSLGFLPQILGVFSNFPQSQSINGKPWTFIINGPGAVVFFASSLFRVGSHDRPLPVPTTPPSW
jgi:peptidoglycan/LPS O-acetylase OafA/YrhL